MVSMLGYSFGMADVLAVFAGAVVSMIIGMLWYSPLMFGKQWAAYRGIKSKADMEKMQKQMAPTMYLAPFLGFLLMGVVLSVVLPRSVPLETVVFGAALLGIGFIGSLQLQAMVFAGKPQGMAAIDFAYNTVCAIAIGICIFFI